MPHVHQGMAAISLPVVSCVIRAPILHLHPLAQIVCFALLALSPEMQVPLFVLFARLELTHRLQEVRFVRTVPLGNI